MNRQISFSEYRAIDLGIMAVLLAVSQAVISLVSTTIYADQLYVVSTVGAVVAIVMMRWGGWAVIHAVLGGIVYTVAGGGSWQQLIIYTLGNTASLGALVLFKLLGKESIRTDALKTIFFALCTQLLMQLGRAGVAVLFGHSIGASLGFITTDALSILFSVCIVWVARRIEGLFEDQKKYLLRIQSEQKVEGREQI